jgi:hypothetical protein
MSDTRVKVFFDHDGGGPKCGQWIEACDGEHCLMPWEEWERLQSVVRRVAALADVRSILELSGEWVALIQQARTVLGAKPEDGEVKP